MGSWRRRLSSMAMVKMAAAFEQQLKQAASLMRRLWPRRDWYRVVRRSTGRLVAELHSFLRGLVAAKVWMSGRASLAALPG